jgi:hypothetical protein
MAETHHHPAGTVLNYGPVGGSATIALTDVKIIEPPSVKNGKSNDTNLANVNAVGTNSAGWGDPGETKINLYLMESQFITLLTIRQARTTRPWMVQYPAVGNETTGMQVAFSAWIADLHINKAEQMNDDKLNYDMTLQMTGDITPTAGTPAA